MSVHTADMAAPASKGVAIVPSDSSANNIPPTRGIYVGVTGDVVVIFHDDPATAVTIKAAAVGYHPLSIIRVNNTSTTATNMVALY